MIEGSPSEMEVFEEDPIQIDLPGYFDVNGDSV